MQTKMAEIKTRAIRKIKKILAPKEAAHMRMKA